MSELLPTIAVKFKETNSEVIINKFDFDAKVHDKLNPEAPVAVIKDETSSLTKAQIVARLEELKATFKSTASKAELEALLVEAEAAAKAVPTMSVIAKDDKFIIVNHLNEQQGDEFVSAEEAEAMLKILSGK